MNISQKTRVKVAGLINDLHLLQSLPGITNDVAKNYRLGKQFMKYLRELEIIDTKDRTVIYTNRKNHSTDYILDYVMSRYEAEYSKEDTPSDLVTCEVELPAHMKGIAQDAIYKNEIRNLQSELNRQEARISTLEFTLKTKDKMIAELQKKKSIFAKIKNLFQ
jgi:hypothetical protein